LAQLCAFSIPSNALALLAVAPLISIVRAFIEHLGHLVRIKIRLGYLIPEEQIGFE
jgi:hypothetical protein